jgi:hypothetical protein
LSPALEVAPFLHLFFGNIFQFFWGRVEIGLGDWIVGTLMEKENFFV